MKKKLVSILLVISMTAGSLVACGKSDAVSDNAVSSDNAASATESSTVGPGQTGQEVSEVVTADGRTISYGTGTINTGNLTETGNGYEGTEGTGNFNYGEALQKSLIFYELQRSGDIPEETRCNWRGDSALNDGSDNGLDLSGGWYDAGDNVKFNLPMSYSAAMLGWSIYEDKDAYEESGQLEYALANIKWANDYFIKCHPEDNKYFYQVGSGSQDHTWWGAAECVELRMDRPSYYVDSNNPGSAVCAETAASLAICSIVYKDIDADYAAECLEHAKSLYKFADDTRSDAGYTAAAGFYDSWSGYYDELAWAGAWLYLATDDNTYLENAESCYTQAGHDYAWAMCWDDVHIGAAVMLARITGKDTYNSEVEKHLDWWTTGTSEGERINYSPQGLAWLDNWGSLRYATTTAYIASVYSQEDGCTASKKDTYWDFAVSQADYALGSTGFSYMIGFGDAHPVNPHHRTAQGSYCDNMNTPSPGRHTLYGALVGGPDASDNYSDDVSNYNNNEVACDYNAGFTGLLAKLYSQYKGQTLVDFGAVEEIDAPEFFVESGINVDGDDFIELRTFVYDESAWPARAAQNLELRYFVDLSEIYDAGYEASNVEVTTNYMQGGTVEGLKTWDEENHIYYLCVTFDDGSLYPGGQEHYKKELQIRLKGPGGVWDDSNDPSFSCMSGSEAVAATTFALYEGDVLVYGAEPASGDNPGQVVTPVQAAASGDNGNTSTQSSSQAVNGTASSESVSVKVEYTNQAQSISGTIDITNNSDGSLAVNDLALNYYFTNDDNKDLTFSCYHAAINGDGGSYTGINGVSASFDSASGTDTDTVCNIKISDNQLLEVGDKLTINFCINYSDWSSFNSSNDYSAKDVENIVVLCDGDVIFGNEP